MKRLFYLLYAVLPVMVTMMWVGCRWNNPPEQKTSGADSVFVLSRIQYHGIFYPGVEQGVVSVDLLSKGLYYDSLYHIHGTGWNMYLSDVFIPSEDTCLQTGTYCSDTTSAPWTFLPGMSFDGSVTGCYLLHIVDSQLDQIILLDSCGMMDVVRKGDTLLLDITMVSKNAKRYRGIYKSVE